MLVATIMDASLSVNFNVDVPATILAVKVGYMDVHGICRGRD